jgi:Protein of unknown function (DUF2797)
MAVTQPPTGSLATGLYWHAGEPGLALADPGCGEHWLPLRPGAAVGWQLAGPRRCTGIWLADSRRRRFCPYRAEVPRSGGAAQCAACAAADPGRRLARDQTLDRRTFGLYLAWFGPGLVKVGITAADRGIDRLAEQGALAFTWLAHGPHPAARAAEQAATTAGVADRIGRKAKIAGWSQPADPDMRREQLAAVHGRLADTINLAPSMQTLPCHVHDLSGRYGLTGPPPAPTTEVSAAGEGSVLAGTLSYLIGCNAILRTTQEALLADLRLLSGWTLTPHTGPARGLRLAPRHPAGSGHAAGQDTLF